MSVEARLTLARHGFLLDAELRLPSTGITGLFGPSGAGKTTLLRCMAGLEEGVQGRLVVDGEVWQEGGRRLPPHRRSVGFVFQDADLFPHLDVRRNLQYGLKRRGPGEGQPEWDEVVGWLALEPLLGRAPARLSGGERQRVAMGRALLSGPRLLLMDEPVASLDEPSRREILPYLSVLRRRLSIPVVYVSHSLLETARIADRMAWMVEGSVRLDGPVHDVLGAVEFARWQGRGAGVVVDARVVEHDEPFHLSRLESPWGDLWVRRQDASPGEGVRVEILAGDVTVARAPDRESSVLNEFEVVITELARGAPGEELVRMGSAAGDGPPLLARITSRSAERLRLEPGMKVWARVKSVAVVD